MSLDNAQSAVTYTSISSNSDGPSWGIPLMNASEFPEMGPYEEVAQQGQVHPLSPDYVPKPMELDEHVPVHVLEPEHPEYHTPSDDDIQVEYDDEDPEEDLKKDPSKEHELEDDDEDQHEPEDEDTKEPSEDFDETKPFEEDETALIDAFAVGSSLFLLPPTSLAHDQAPLGHRTTMIRMRDDILEEDMPLQRRFVLTALPPGCDVAESFVAAAKVPRAFILKKLPKKLGDPRKFLILCGYSELKCKALADLGASINLMPLAVWKKLGLPELISNHMTLELANRAICTPTRIARDVFVLVGKLTFPADFIIVDYESDPRAPLILGRPFLRTARALIDVHEEEMILRDADERLTLNMRHDTSSYLNQPQKESINMINIFDDSYEDYLKDLFTTNHLSGNPTFSSHTDLTSPEVINLSVHVLEPEHLEYHASLDDDIQVEDDDEDPEEDPNEEHEPEDEDTREPSRDSDETEPFEEDEPAVTPPPPRYRRARIFVRPQTPMVASTQELINAFATGSSPFLLPPTSLAYDQAPLGHRTTMIRRRDDIPEEDIPHRRRFAFTDPLHGCDIAESSVAATARTPRSQYDFVDTVEAGHDSRGHDAQTIARAADRAKDVGYVRALQVSERRMMTSIEEVNLRTDRRDVRLEIDVVRGQRTTYETELREVHQAYLSFEARNRALLARLETLETYMIRIEWQRQSAKDLAVIQMMQDVGYVRALQASERRMMTSIEEVNLRVSYQAQVRRMESKALLARLETLETHVSRIKWQGQSAEDLAVTQKMRIHTLEAKARTNTVEDAGGSCATLTWWNGHVRTLGHEAAYAMTWGTLKK
nr:reverse transcriptase domain-containing protein [Tanacetum cinerariifolium]